MAIKPENAKDPQDYIEQIDEPRRSEIEALDKLIREEGPNLKRDIEYGMLVYGSESDAPGSEQVGAALASQKRYISLYVTCETDQGYLAEQYRDRLPKAKIGKSCIRFNRLADVDEEVLRELIREAATEPGEAPPAA